MAKNLGVIGQTYTIVEVDFLEWIKARLNAMQQNGEIRLAEQQLQQQAKRYIVRPKPVSFVTKAIVDRTFMYDPSFTVPNDIKDHQGHLLYPAGTRVNPLDKVSLKNALLFFDSHDAAQVTWAKKMDNKLNGKDKLILVNGDVILQQKQWQRAVYFDQQGLLVGRLGILSVPAIVTQQGNHLLIHEVKLP